MPGSDSSETFSAVGFSVGSAVASVPVLSSAVSAQDTNDDRIKEAVSRIRRRFFVEGHSFLRKMNLPDSRTLTKISEQNFL